ncbi:uncharacterized protein LOC144907810 [Branchiostoma floridae x Branchiostoma belcheri]
MATALPKISVLEDSYSQVDLSASVPPLLARGSLTEAWRKVLRNDGPLLPEEWRLPHGPLPARPDYSRVSRGQSYPQDQRRIERERKLRKAWRLSRLSDSYSGAHQNHSELYIDNGGVSGWVSQPLRFVPIVGFPPFNVRSVCGTEVRDHVHNPRGLCHGCVRLICDPSYLAAEHPERVGGGYLYGEERGRKWSLGGTWWRGGPTTHPTSPADDWDTNGQMKLRNRPDRNASSLPRLPSYNSAGKSADDSNTKTLKTKGTRPTRDQGSRGSAVSLPKVGSPALSRARSCSIGSKDPDAIDLENVNLPRIGGLNSGQTPPVKLDAGDDSDLDSDRMDLHSLNEDVADAETRLSGQVSGKLQAIDEDIEGMASKMRPGSADSGLGSTLSGGTSSDDSSYAQSRKRAEIVRKQGKHVRWKRNPVQVEFLVEPTLEETSPVPSSPALSGSGSDMTSPTPDPEWTEDARSVELPPLPSLPDLESGEEDAKKDHSDIDFEEKHDVTEGVRSAKTAIKRKPKPKPKSWRDLIKPVHSVPATRSRSANDHVDDVIDDAHPDDDPLDYLAKYCIVRPNRLPTYEAIFTWFAKEPEEEEEVNKGRTAFNQSKKLKKSSKKSASSSSLRSDKDSGDDEKKMEPKEMFNDTPQDYKEKVASKIAFLQGKQDDLRGELHQLRENLVRSIAEEARRPGALSGVKTKKGKKGKKKSKKSKSKKGGASAAGSAVSKNTQLRKMSDKELLESLTKQEKESLESLIQVKRVRAEITSREDRIKKMETRIKHLQDEIRRADWKLTKQRQTDLRQYTQSPGFRRAQSSRYRTMHPEIDVELDVEDLKDALLQVNSHLSTKELDFISQVLDIPGRRRLNLKLFSAVAALSERITEVEPFVKKLIDKMDFEALAVKMERCKEMFRLLSDQYNDTPPGTVKTHALGVEMVAGGLRNEQIKRVLCKLDREGTGLVDFLTYLIYIPLFIEIHERIVDDPLASDRFR